MIEPKIHIINKETGEELVFPASSVSGSQWNPAPDIPTVDIQTSYHFECSVNWEEMNPVNEAYKNIFYGSRSWRDACRLADELNDLIEEYHSPGLPRRERRAVKRQFDKIFLIFRKHCAKYEIDFKFIRT